MALPCLPLLVACCTFPNPVTFSLFSAVFHANRRYTDHGGDHAGFAPFHCCGPCVVFPGANPQKPRFPHWARCLPQCHRGQKGNRRVSECSSEHIGYPCWPHWADCPHCLTSPHRPA